MIMMGLESPAVRVFRRAHNKQEALMNDEGCLEKRVALLGVLRVK